mgnify:CR=1 FL=1
MGLNSHRRRLAFEWEARDADGLRAHQRQCEGGARPSPRESAGRAPQRRELRMQRVRMRTLRLRTRAQEHMHSTPVAAPAPHTSRARRRTHTLTTSHCTPFYGFVTLYYYFDFCRLLNYSFPHYLLLLSYSFYSLVQFFEWEIGYMRSIDIIVDRAGWEIQWGCLVWVPSVYTLHSRFLVANPSGLSPLTAGAIFAVGFLGVLLNYWVSEEQSDQMGIDKTQWRKEGTE